MDTPSQTKMRVPYGYSVHGQEEIDAVVAVLQGNTALGPKTEEFEAKIAALLGKKHGVMVNSGSSANLLAFELLGLPRGSEVITPLLTFSTTVAPIVQKGLIPVFVDVDPTTFIINMEQVEAAITEKTKVLMIPSLMGNIPQMDKLQELAEKHGLWFIEDSCDTLGGTYKGKPSGTYSHITTTSFYGSHIINGAGGGGMICINDDEWYERLLVLRGWGRQSSLFDKDKSELIANRFNTELAGIPYDNKFIFSEIGYNFLPLELSAAFALVQLGKFPKNEEARRTNFADMYEHAKKNWTKYFDLPEQTPDTETVWLAFPLIIKEGAPFTRLELVSYLEEENIQTRPIFTGNILKQPGFAKVEHRLAQESYPNAENVMRNGFVVGSHHGLTPEQIAYMKDRFEAFLSKFE